MKTTLVALIIVVALIAGGWYWWMNNGYSMMPAQQNTATTTASTTATSRADNSAYIAGNLLLGTDATSSLGTYLIASNGMTLYIYTKDSSGVSNCTGQCAAVWPPYTVASRDVLANVQAGISGSVDTILRADGSMQVTYNGAPLYFYAKDQVSGDTTGQNVGGVWFVAKP